MNSDQPWTQDGDCNRSAALLLLQVRRIAIDEVHEENMTGFSSLLPPIENDSMNKPINVTPQLPPHHFPFASHSATPSDDDDDTSRDQGEDSDYSCSVLESPSRVSASESPTRLRRRSVSICSIELPTGSPSRSSSEDAFASPVIKSLQGIDVACMNEDLFMPTASCESKPVVVEVTPTSKRKSVEVLSPKVKRKKISKSANSTEEDAEAESPSQNKQLAPPRLVGCKLEGDRTLKAVLRKKFSWKNYPELEAYLVEHRPRYLQYSSQLNYTAEQKRYNNQLTQGLLDVAATSGYVFEDFTFAAVRDRIRCYYKSYVQAAKKTKRKKRK